MRSIPIGGRPLPGLGQNGSHRADSADHGTTRSISARNAARRVVLAYRSNPTAASVNCFIPPTQCSNPPRQYYTTHCSWLLQRFLSHEELYSDRSTVHVDFRTC